jgi:hypothetical protein
MVSGAMVAHMVRPQESYLLCDVFRAVSIVITDVLMDHRASQVLEYLGVCKTCPTSPPFTPAVLDA